jgi:hypothetical protein
MSATKKTTHGKRDVTIGLTPSQIAKIIHHTAAGPGRSGSRTRRLVAPRGISNSTVAKDLYYDDKFALSVIRGLMVLRAFADGNEHSAKEVAKELDIPVSTIRRYIRTWAAINILYLDPISRVYRLVPRLSERILNTPDAPPEITG